MTNEIALEGCWSGGELNVTAVCNVMLDTGAVDYQAPTFACEVSSKGHVSAA